MVSPKIYIMTSNFFSSYYSYWYVSNLPRQFFFEKQGISVIFGFFQECLALFDTFTTRYSHWGIKFEFFDSFWSIKPFKSNNNFENFEKQLKMPFRPLCILEYQTSTTTILTDCLEFLPDWSVAYFTTSNILKRK